jgi:hypothetical protein
VNAETAERWVVIGAAVTGVVYGYRALTEGTAAPAGVKSKLKAAIGTPKPAPLGTFATAWGITWMVVAVITQAAPAFGGAFAILIMSSDLLVSVDAIVKDTKLSPTSSTSTSSSSGSSAPAPAPLSDTLPGAIDTPAAAIGSAITHASNP